MSFAIPTDIGTLFRFGMPVLFVLMAVMAITQQRKLRAKLAETWRALADETGGAYSEEKRAIVKNEWVGGPTVRWTIRGLPVTLSSHRQGKNSAGTRLQASVRLVRPFQFHVMTQGALARLASSPRLWNLVLETAEKEADKKAGTDENAGAAKEAIHKLRFMAAEPVKTGDSLFDEAFLLKTDDPDRARDFFGSSGVSYWMQELKKTEKGWSLALAVADLNGSSGLTLELQGIDTNPAALRAARSLVEGAIGRLADQGVLAGSGRPAA
ncbi:MAG TPA: hypothetical protein VF363_05025 [Candidatus Eisenbacteria bacterium]